MTAVNPARLWRCTGCGGWRYYQNRPCHTCRILENRHALGRETAPP